MVCLGKTLGTTHVETCDHLCWVLGMRQGPVCSKVLHKVLPQREVKQLLLCSLRIKIETIALLHRNAATPKIQLKSNQHAELC